MSPTPGTDNSGAAAIIKSYCKADLRKQYTGAALDIGFVPSNIDSENAILAISGLIKGFVLLGGCFMQIDTTDADILRDAQKHPEDVYKRQDALCAEADSIIAQNAEDVRRGRENGMKQGLIDRLDVYKRQI